MPAGWKLWWVEGQIIHSQSLKHDTGLPGHMWQGRQFRIGEMDPPSGSTFDAIISYWMAHYDFADGDRVSLVGHVPGNATKIGAPSFLVDHDSGAYCPVGLGLPDSWVVCGGDEKRGGLGMIMRGFKAGSGASGGDLQASIWKHIQESCKSKPGYIWPLYYDLMQWIVQNQPKGPNARIAQQDAGTINF